MLVAVVWVVASVWRRQSKPYPHLVPLGVLFTVLLFIPGCVGVAYLYDAVVYREFGYDSPPGHVFRYRIPMPDCAKSIRVRLYASGHRAVFKVPEAALGDWMRSLELEEARHPVAKMRRNRRNLRGGRSRPTHPGVDTGCWVRTGPRFPCGIRGRRRPPVRLSTTGDSRMPYRLYQYFG